VPEAAYSAELSAEKDELADRIVSGVPSAAEGFSHVPKHVVGEKSCTSPLVKSVLTPTKTTTTTAVMISTNIQG